MHYSALKIESYKGRILPVFLKYENRSSPQSSFIFLDCNGTVFADFIPGPEGSISDDIYFQRILSWQIPSTISGNELDSLISKIKPLLEMIFQGFSIDKRTENYIGVLNEDARFVSNRIDSICNSIEVSESPEILDYSEWLINIKSVLELTKIIESSGSKNFDELGSYLKSMAIKKNVFLIGNLENEIFLLFDSHEERTLIKAKFRKNNRAKWKSI